MKMKSIVIILVLAMLFLAAGLAYSEGGPPGSTFGPPAKGHPWEEFNDDTGPSGSSAMVIHEARIVIMIPIFSDFLIWIRIRDIRKGGDLQESSDKINDKSYQIIFPW